MTAFWKLRLATLAWGFAVLYLFTGEIGMTSKVFLVQVLGNSALMWWFTR